MAVVSLSRFSNFAERCGNCALGRAKPKYYYYY